MAMTSRAELPYEDPVLSGTSEETASVEVASVETVLTDIWRRVFGAKGRDTDGHILHIPVGMRRVVRFLQDVEATLGVRIPPTALLRLGTIKAVAAAIEQGVWPAPSPLVLLRDGGGEGALYIVSAGSGLILELCDLALLIDFPGQIWALQAPGLDGEAAPLSSIGDYAAHYAAGIRGRGARGPCHLIGYSFGGLVVVELARRLAASGQELGMVGLLDTTCYELFWPKSEWIRFALWQIGRRLLELRAMPAGQAIGHLAGRVAAGARYIRRRWDKTPAQAGANRSIYYKGGLEPDFQRVRDAAIVAFEAYRPTAYDGRIVLFKSRLGDRHACDPVGIWKRLVRDLEIVVVPGSHVTMIRKPLAQTLADEIARRLG
jgi:thioesterase domain-containing protein